jgi:glycosyltransferase involved in cell wall biosynthesis
MDLVPLRHGLIFFTKRKARENHNLRYLDRVLAQYQPDVIFIWGMWNLPRSLAVMAEARRPGKVVYRFAEYWPTLPSQHEFYWRVPGRKWYSQFPKKVLSSIALSMLARENQYLPLNFEHTICVSAATRDELVNAGIPVSNARIIHTGLDVDLFFHNRLQHQSDDENKTIELLYAGRLSETKGVETTIKAMELLVGRRGLPRLRLNLAGSGSEEYESCLRQLVVNANLDPYVSFLGHLPYEEMPRRMRACDILLVPSIWPEPFARVVLEGMLSGMVVVATPAGGTGEIVIDGENGLFFEPGNSEDLADKITNLIKDPELRHRLALAGQQTIIERFSIASMLDEIESTLQQVVDFSPEAHSALAGRI